MPSADPSGLNIGWVWTACHLSHPFITFHISVFSEVASFPSFSLLGHFLFYLFIYFFMCSEFCHTLKWKGLGFTWATFFCWNLPPVSAPVACAMRGHASLVSASVRGRLVGVARLPMTPSVPLLPGVARWGFMFPSMNHPCGWRGRDSALFQIKFHLV